jgi:hypothetical protein
MAASSTVKQLARKSARRARAALFPGYTGVRKDIGLLFESVTAAHKGIADLQVEQRSLRERLDATLLLAEANEVRVRDVELGLVEERRLNLRIAELTDIVTEIVLPLHDREIDLKKLDNLAPDTL